MRKYFAFVLFLCGSWAVLFNGAGGCSSTGAGLLLEVTAAGPFHSGKIVSSPSGIDCGSSCQTVFASGTDVTLTAQPATGFAFSGWSGGGCTGTGPCHFIITADTNITGTFGTSAHVALIVTGNGTGTVTSETGGLSCARGGGTCATDVGAGATVTFTATPDAGFLFNRWRGAACPPGPTCTLTVSADTNLEASFTRILYKSTRALDGTDATQPGIIKNLWMTTTDGADQLRLTGFLHAPSDNPRLCPDANKVAYSSNRNLSDMSGGAGANPVSNIWVENADGSGGDIAVTKTTASGAFSDNPQWTPDQTKIIYVSSRSTTDIENPAAPRANSSNLWASNADGSGGDAPLTSFNQIGVNVEGPFVLSPDGAKIVFSSTLNLSKNPADPPNPAENIWIINSDGSGLTALTQNTASGVLQQTPEWSPDGSAIVWVSRRSLSSSDPAAAPASSYNLWIMKADGSNPLALTNKDAGSIDSFNERWSPDGRTLLFVSNMNTADPAGGPRSRPNLFRINPDGTGLNHITNTASFFVGDPEWAPDGSLVLFDSSRDFNDLTLDAPNANNTANLFTMDPDGSNLVVLTKVDTLQGDSLTPLGSGS